jgi:ribonucleoside-diphosphate reductase alpha chain
MREMESEGKQGVRRRLPDERRALTHKFTIHAPSGDYKGYITVGLYEDGTPGEVFLKMDKAGGTIRGFADAWAIAVSMLLQTGTPLATICEKFKGMRFEPGGPTDTPEIRVAQSPMDYVARWLELRFSTQAPKNETP